MPLIDIGNGLKQYVADASNGLEQQQQLMSLLQLKQQTENSKLQGQILGQNLKQEEAMTANIPLQRQKLQSELVAQQQQAAKQKGEAFNDALDKIPGIIRSQGVEVANQFLQTRVPGATLTQPDKDGAVFFNLPNGVSLATNPNPKPGQTLNAKDLIQTETSLAQDFEKVTSGQNQALLAYDNIEKLASKGKGGIDDVAILYMLIKGLDPGSTVREGEVTLTQSASPLAQRISLAYQKAFSTNGSAITPEQRKQYVDLAREQKVVLQGQLAPVIQRYGKIATDYGLDAERIIAPRGVVNSPEAILQAPEAVRKSLGLLDTPGSEKRIAALENSTSAESKIQAAGRVQDILNAQLGTRGQTSSQPALAGLPGPKSQQNATKVEEKKKSNQSLNDVLSTGLFTK